MSWCMHGYSPGSHSRDLYLRTAVVERINKTQHVLFVLHGLHHYTIQLPLECPRPSTQANSAFTLKLSFLSVLGEAVHGK